MCNLSDAIEERGIQQGEERKLIELICYKVRKGRTLQVIAEELVDIDFTKYSSAVNITMLVKVNSRTSQNGCSGVFVQILKISKI